jgi:hypothetical protein
MSKIDKAYDQVAHPSAGTTAQAGKDSMCNTDALGKPGRYPRNASTVAEPKDVSRELINKQNGSNGMQGN